MNNNPQQPQRQGPPPGQQRPQQHGQPPHGSPAQHTQRPVNQQAKIGIIMRLKLLAKRQVRGFTIMQIAGAVLGILLLCALITWAVGYRTKRLVEATKPSDVIARYELELSLPATNIMIKTDEGGYQTIRLPKIVLTVDSINDRVQTRP